VRREAVSRAERQLAEKRWASTKPDRFIRELHARADQLGDKQLSELRELVDEATEKVSE
jgi:hypothetical protein